MTNKDRSTNSTLEINAKLSTGSPGLDVDTFLLKALANGPLSVSELERQARATGLVAEHQRITVSKKFKAAKTRLSIRSIRHGFGGGGEWFWTLQSLPASEGEGHLCSKPKESVSETEDKTAVTYGGGVNDAASNFATESSLARAEDMPAPPKNLPASELPGHLCSESKESGMAPEAKARVIYGTGVDGSGRSSKESALFDPDITLPWEFRNVVNVPRDWLLGIASLNYERAPQHILPHCWHQFIMDCYRFVLSPEGWAQRAAFLGWSTAELFGCSPVNPLGHRGVAGLLWNLCGGRIVHLHADGAQIEAGGRSLAFNRRRITPARVVLAWSLR